MRGVSSTLLVLSDASARVVHTMLSPPPCTLAREFMRTTTKSWTLIDAERNLRDEIALAARETEIAGTSLRLQRLRGGLRDGVDSLEVDNGRLRVAILPIADPTGLGWLDGFDELLCRCGLSSNGAPEFTEQGRLAWPLHGRTANLPVHKLQVECDADQRARHPLQSGSPAGR